MTWNHRVLRQTNDGEVMFSIHEVYYDDDGNPHSWTGEAVSFGGDTYKELQEAYMQMIEAFMKPVLEVVGTKLVERKDRK